MKKFMVLCVAFAMVATASFAESLPPTKENIKKAENTPSSAKFFLSCSGSRPTGENANIPGDVVFVNNNGILEQYGSSLTPLQAYDLYCTGKNGKK